MASLAHIASLWRYAPGSYRRSLPDSPAARARAAVQAPLLDTRAAVGAAWFPAVYEGDESGRLPGFLVRVRAGLDLPGQTVTEPSWSSILAWVAGLAGVGPETFPSGLRLVLDPPPPTPIRGPSLELAGAAAVISLLTGRMPAEAPIASAKLSPDGGDAIAAIHNAELKREIIRREAPSCAAPLVAGRDGRAAAWLAGLFGADWRDALIRACERTPESLVREAWRAHNARNHGPAVRLATAALDTTRGVHRALALWIVGADDLHRGQAGQGLQRLVEARELLAVPSDEEVAEHDVLLEEHLAAHLGIGLLDNLRIRSAIDVLGAALERLADSQVRHGRRWRSVGTQVAGSLCRALRVAGEFERAATTLEAWSLGRAALPEERARSLQGLAAIQLASGRRERAVETLEAARRALPDAMPDERLSTAGYIRLTRIRAGVDAVEPCEGLPPAPDWRHPLKTLETLERLARSDAELVSQWFERHVVASRSEVTPPVLMLFLRLLAAHAGAPALGATTRELIRGLRAVPGGELDGAPNDALSALEGGIGAPWLALCPY
ncbi:MAG: hypothetical protein EP329_09980 [Deltaproteobacteria bacterium]|nr:MAG: hypothetical protein EP329_09980 [Deltaproteobacteria bacterium]